ncbi:MAG: hypothetical protein QW575_08450 [Thermoproteota archaeon]
MTNNKYSNNEYIRKYLGLSQAKDLIQTFPLFDLYENDKIHFKNLIVSKNVKEIINLSEKKRRIQNMVLKENKYYWGESIKHFEPAADDFYIFNKVIVSDVDFIKKVKHLRELIISYCVVSEKDKSISAKILDEIYNIIISIDKIQYTEFVAF